jgi:hypothetical protein
MLNSMLKIFVGPVMGGFEPPPINPPPPVTTPLKSFTIRKYMKENVLLHRHDQWL